MISITSVKAVAAPFVFVIFAYPNLDGGLDYSIPNRLTHYAMPAKFGRRTHYLIPARQVHFAARDENGNPAV